ncbi:MULTISPECIES: glutaredoxin family protein [Mesobacillus]|uniref:glutaredoxin family protein n=1 Tax=Mesobacillus TaxID=2675231 RepID=UPI00177BBCA7|nr:MULTISPECIES: glutaredoxin domain-containing protein [Mesobacillus]MCM3572966.1 glutathione S-transferase N-terminal domain-containing protein [Mesobacillus subterraneus]UYZ23429.1 glutathione S-transferase N-terminal domain-containing protein [Mesobacillus jeotgali]
MKDIIVYTQNDCPPCQIIKMFLTEFGFSYTEKNINLDDQSKQELTENYNSYSTPTIVIGEEIITGFDLEKLKRVLEIKD